MRSRNPPLRSRFGHNLIEVLSADHRRELPIKPLAFSTRFMADHIIAESHLLPPIILKLEHLEINSLVGIARWNMHDFIQDGVSHRTSVDIFTPSGLADSAGWLWVHGCWLLTRIRPQKSVISCR